MLRHETFMRSGKGGAFGKLEAGYQPLPSVKFERHLGTRRCVSWAPRRGGSKKASEGEGKGEGCRTLDHSVPAGKAKAKAKAAEHWITRSPLAKTKAKAKTEGEGEGEGEGCRTLDHSGWKKACEGEGEGEGCRTLDHSDPSGEDKGEAEGED